MGDDLADRRGVNQTVYNPAEDSTMLAEVAVDTIDGEMLVLEVGTGSGMVAERIRSETGAMVIASDINPHACSRARERGLPVVRTDLCNGFQSATFDIVVFNPPYLPLDPDAEREDWLERALTGGEVGNEVVTRFLTEVGEVLRSDGRLLVVLSSLTDIDSVLDTATAAGFRPTERDSIKFPFEELSVYEFVPRSTP